MVTQVQIPADWVLRRVDEIAPLQRGFDLPAKQIVEGKYPVVYSNGILNYHNTFQAKAPGVVTGRSGTIGKVTYIKQNYWPHNTSLWVTDFKGNDPKFIYYLYSFLGLERFRTGSGVPTLNRNDVHSFQILLPKYRKEQSAIAKALSDIDALIESLDRLIEKKKNINQGAMQELLTGKKRLPGSWDKKKSQKRTSLGYIPEDWDVKKLGEIAYVTKLAGYEYSNYFNSYKDSGDIIVIRGTNITNNKLDLSDVRTIPQVTSDRLPRSKLFVNDLVFAYVGTIGPVFLIEDDNMYHLGPNTCKIAVEKSVLPIYLFCYFTSWLINKEITEQTSIGAQPSLSMSKIRNFELIVPGSIDEQNAIAEVLSNMTKEIEALEQKRDKYRQLKVGMMQQLLTGRIRLKCKN